jgi:regulator of protease activity HflC (stomatin/prohibitin superfamily)
MERYNVSNKTMAVVAIVIFVLIALLTSFYTVETGEVGVVKYFGKVSDITNEGLNFKVPFISSVDKISIRDNKLKVDIEVSSRDMQTIRVQSQLIYSIPASSVQRIYATYKTDIESILLLPTLQEKIQSTIAQYPIDQFIEKRPIISAEIAKSVREQVHKSGAIIESFLLVNHDFSEEYDKSIEQKKIAEQNAQRAAYELEQKRLEAEAQILKQTSLTPLVLQEMAIQKWDGKLPHYWGGNGNLPFIMKER